MIAVTFALPAESSDFIHLLKNRKRSGKGNEQTISGTLHGTDLRILHTGVGGRAASVRMEAFLRQNAPRFLISGGFAGGLDAALRVGDLFLAENFSSPELFARAHEFLGPAGLRAGRLTTTAVIADSSANRAELARAANAEAVDMETASISHACSQKSIPLLSLRVITDTPASPFPAPPAVLFSIARQKTVYADLLPYLLTHPRSIGRLITFAKQISGARKTLANALDMLLRADLLGASRL